MIESGKNVPYTDENNEERKVSYIAYELAPKGELFKYIAKKGGLPTPIVRYYAE